MERDTRPRAWASDFLCYGVGSHVLRCGTRSTTTASMLFHALRAAASCHGTSPMTASAVFSAGSVKLRLPKGRCPGTNKSQYGVHERRCTTDSRSALFRIPLPLRKLQGGTWRRSPAGSFVASTACRARLDEGKATAHPTRGHPPSTRATPPTAWILCDSTPAGEIQ